tara:strand:- start:760 stop:963 length:204 start_codon:yes stop_codon:yes gene_type:complete
MEEGGAVHAATMTASRAMLKGVSGLKGAGAQGGSLEADRAWVDTGPSPPKASGKPMAEQDAKEVAGN